MFGGEGFKPKNGFFAKDEVQADVEFDMECECVEVPTSPNNMFQSVHTPGHLDNEMDMDGKQQCEVPYVYAPFVGYHGHDEGMFDWLPKDALQTMSHLEAVVTARRMLYIMRQREAFLKSKGSSTSSS